MLASVRETELYDLLGLEPQASLDEIQAAYNKLVDQTSSCSPAEEDAAIRAYEAYGIAYTVLSDPVQRAKYNAYGKQGLQDQHVNDIASVLCAALDNNKFKDYVGQLPAARASVMLFNGIAYQEHTSKFAGRLVQAGREERLARILAQKLQSFVEGDKAAFGARAIFEVDDIAGHLFGTPMLHLIGSCYSRGAEEILREGMGVWLKRTSHGLRSQVSAASGALSFKFVQRDMRNIRTMSLDQAEAIARSAEYIRDRVGRTIGLVWGLVARDVEATLGRVCSSLLRDPALDEQTRRLRAEGLAALGTLLQGAKRRVHSSTRRSSVDSLLPLMRPLQRESLDSPAAAAVPAQAAFAAAAPGSSKPPPAPTSSAPLHLAITAGAPAEPMSVPLLSSRLLPLQHESGGRAQQRPQRDVPGAAEGVARRGPAGDGARQAQELSRCLRPIAQRLPEAMRRAAVTGRVPKELQVDVLVLADEVEHSLGGLAAAVDARLHPLGRGVSLNIIRLRPEDPGEE